MQHQHDTTQLDTMQRTLPATASGGLAAAKLNERTGASGSALSGTASAALMKYMSSYVTRTPAYPHSFRSSNRSCAQGRTSYDAVARYARGVHAVCTRYARGVHAVCRML